MLLALRNSWSVDHAGRVKRAWALSPGQAMPVIQTPMTGGRQPVPASYLRGLPRENARQLPSNNFVNVLWRGIHHRPTLSGCLGLERSGRSQLAGLGIQIWIGSAAAIPVPHPSYTPP